MGPGPVSLKNGITFRFLQSRIDFVISSCAVNIPPKAVCFLHIPAQPGGVPDQPPSSEALSSSASSCLNDAIRLKRNSEDYIEVVN